MGLLADRSLFPHALGWRWRGRRFRRQPTLPAILLYHSVSDRARDPLKLAVPVRTFAEHLAWFSRHATPLPLAEFVDCLVEGRLPANAVALTFDDGYRDNITTAEPLLRRHGIPATVFVATDYIGQPGEGWWDELEALLLDTETLPAHFAHGGLAFDVDERRDPRRGGWSVLHPPGTRREHAFLAASAHAGGLSRAERQHLLAALRAWSGRDGAARPDRALASWDELADVSRRGLVSIGAHTRSHPVLARRPRVEQVAEIAGSIADVRTRLGSAPVAFAYPFGTFHDFSPATCAIARDAGIPLACANMAGRLGARMNRWQLPRLLVWDWPAEELGRRLGQ